jgi:hypothetical protein
MIERDTDLLPETIADSVCMRAAYVVQDVEAASREEALAKARAHFGGNEQPGVRYIESNTYCEPALAEFDVEAE